MNTIIIPILPVRESIEVIALECLRRTRMFSRDYHLVVVVNGEGGGSEEFRRQVSRDAHELLIFPERLGYAKAINEGLNLIHPQSDHITIGSCDIYPIELWQRWLETSDSLVSPLDMSKTQAKDIGYRGDFWAAWWTMPTAAFETVGSFDENFNLRFAANDYGIRAHQAGYPARRVGIYFDHVAAQHSSVGPGFKRAIRDEERRFRAQWGGAYNYKTWVDAQGSR